MSRHQNSLKFRRVEYFLQANDMRMENIGVLWKIFVKDIDIQIRLEAKWKYFGKIKHGENWKFKNNFLFMEEE